MKELFRIMGKFKVLLIASVLLTIVSVASQLWQPDLLKQVIGGIASNNTTDLYKYGAQLVIFAVVGLCAGILNTIIAAKISQRVGMTLRQEVFAKVQEFSFSNIEAFSASGLVVRLTNDVQQAQNLVMILLQSLMRIPLLFIGSFILAITQLPNLWWVILLLIVLVFIIMMISFGMMGPKFEKLQQLLENVNTIAKENFSGMRVVKSFVQEDNQIDKFNVESVQLTKETIAVGVIFSFMIPTFMLVAEGIQTLVLLLIGNMVDMDPTVIGSAIAFTSYLGMIMMAIIIGGMMMSFSSRAFVSLGRIEEVLDTEASIKYGEVNTDLTDGSIKFDNVTFAYHGEEERTLTNISFEIKEGQTAGIVGATGSGKSTLGQMIARIFDPSEGEIIVGGKSLTSLSEASLRKNISIVLQRPILFSGTIADNIRQGKKDATLEEIKEAADKAQASEFIEVRDNGYDSEVYQRGANFSGGQKQRISIARGLVGQPKILVLDDSTSALDARSEKQVKNAIMERMPNTTKVIVSQKISSIVTADIILVLDNGTLVGQGTHKELLQTCPTYVEIFDTQKGKEV